MFKCWKKKREIAKKIATDDYLKRLECSVRNFTGTRYSTFDDTLSIGEIQTLMREELERLTQNT